MGGKKVWLEANATAQEVEFTVNASGNTVALEYYEHDTLPMGLVESTVTIGALVSHHLRPVLHLNMRRRLFRVSCSSDKGLVRNSPSS